MPLVRRQPHIVSTSSQPRNECCDAAVRRRIPSIDAGAGVRLNAMRNRPANWVIAALLMLQLAIGLSGRAAYAGSLPEHPMSGAMEAVHCPGHQSSTKHDCCRSLGCQGHSALSPGVLNLPPSRVAFSSLDLLSTCNARPAVARTNEFFRPPIA